eukprot:882008_1
MGCCGGKRDQENVEEFLDLEAGGAVVDVDKHAEVDQSLEKSPPPPFSGHRTTNLTIGVVALLVITAVISGLYLYGYFSAGNGSDQSDDQADDQAAGNVSHYCALHDCVDVVATAANTAARNVASRVVREAAGDQAAVTLSDEQLTLENEIAEAVRAYLDEFIVNVPSNGKARGLYDNEAFMNSKNMNVHLALDKECETLSAVDCKKLNDDYILSGDGRK